MLKQSARLPCVRTCALGRSKAPGNNPSNCCTGAVKQRTEIVNEARAALLEEGITIAQGIEKVRSQLPRILEDAENGLCPPMRTLVADLHERIQMLDKSIKGYDQQVIEIAEADEDCQRLQTIPGIGPLAATAIKMSMGEAENFSSGRHFAAWLGLVPRQVSTGGKPKLLFDSAVFSI